MAIKKTQAQKKLGSAIRSKREEAGHSQEEFASICDVHRTYIGSIERGERNLSLKNIINIASALKISSSELLELANL